MSNKFELTDPFVRNHKPVSKQIQYTDSKVPGLKLRITKNGAKSFSFRYYINGKEKRYSIGLYPQVKVGAARRIARSLHEKVMKGEDPQRERVKSRDDITIAELAEVFKEGHLPTLKPSTQHDYKNRIDSVIVPAIGGIIAKKIEPDDIHDLLEEIAENAPIQSNRVRAIMSSMFSFAQRRRYVTINPVAGVPRLGKENQRNRYYEVDEIPILWEFFNDMPQPTQSLFKMLLITGQRLGETRQMEWNQIDDNHIWTIPEKLTKAKREHKVPLPPMAVNVLQQVGIVTGGGKFVFESPINKGEPIRWVQFHAKNIRDAENGISDFRIHDIRHTVTTHMADLQVNRTVLGKVLNHKQMAGDNHITARYDQYDYMTEKTEALQRWNYRLESIISGTESERPGAKIFKMR